MAHYNICPECGFSIGVYIEFVDAARLAIYKEEIFDKKSDFAAYDPEKMVLSQKSTPSLEKIFDGIGVKNRCCRMHLVTKTEFDKQYK